MELKYILYGCNLLLVVGNLAGAAKIFGAAGIDSSSAGIQAGVSFPKIPGINSPILGLSIFPTASSNNSSNNWNIFNNLFPQDLADNNKTSSSRENLNNSTSSPVNQKNTSFIQRALSSLLPNTNKLVPNLGELSGNITVPSITGAPSLDSLPNIPGLSDALEAARNRVQIAFNATGNFSNGIETSLRQALESGNPTGAVRTLVNTILDAYLTVAENCPAIVVATRVLREGIRLAIEVARSARNVAIGT